MVILISGSVTSDSSYVRWEHVSRTFYSMSTNYPKLTRYQRLTETNYPTQPRGVWWPDIQWVASPTVTHERSPLSKGCWDSRSQKDNYRNEQSIGGTRAAWQEDSLRNAGIPESDNDDTDSAILNICSAIEVDAPVQPSDIAVSHRLGKNESGKTRQIIVKFATRNVREQVYSSKKKLKSVKRKAWVLWHEPHLH